MNPSISGEKKILLAESMSLDSQGRHMAEKCNSHKIFPVTGQQSSAFWQTVAETYENRSSRDLMCECPHRKTKSKHLQIRTEKHIQPSSFLDMVTTVLEKNLANENFQISDLAKHLYCSRTQVYRKLKVALGTSFTDLVKEMKVDRAKSLIAKTDQSITEISQQLGFRDASYFTRVFKQITGKTPSAFRSEHLD